VRTEYDDLKQSGIDSEHGPVGLEGYLEYKSIDEA
jgi:hypothetical protein